jgi:site-specific recombinase XerD
MFINDFLEFKKIDHHCSPLTIDAYRRDLHALQRWWGHPLETLSKADMRRYVADMEVKGMSDATIKRQWSTFTQFFAYLIDEAEIDGLARSPTRGFKFPINDREESFHLEPEQRKQLFDYLIEESVKSSIGKLDLSLFGLLYYAGLRVSEGVTRTFEDMYTDENGHPRLHIIGKRNKERVVVIHPTALKWLQDWFDARPQIVLNPDYLFIHPARKQVISRKLAWRRLKTAMQNAGLDEETIKQTSPHTLRHTRATDLRKGGYDLLVIRRFLGHSSVRTTEIYTHIEDPEVDKAVLGVN